VTSDEDLHPALKNVDVMNDLFLRSGEGLKKSPSTTLLPQGFLFFGHKQKMS
jgi:hypothetical protein